MNQVKTENVGTAAFLLIFSFFNVYIYMLQKGQLESRFDYCILFANVVILTVLLFILANKIHKMSGRRKDPLSDADCNMADGRWAGLVWILQTAAWFPVFLAYYPGLFNYDVIRQVPQAMGNYDMHHPLAHTLYLQFFYYIVGEKIFKSHNAGIAVAAVVQMGVFSAMLAYIHLFCRRMRMKKAIRRALIAASCLLPVFSMLVIAMTKDVFFAGCTGVLFAALGYWYRLREYCTGKSFAAVYILSIVGTLLFRNNGIYPLIILAVSLAVQAVFRKDTLKILLYTSLGIFLGLLISTGLRVGLQARKGSVNEALSLPYQQIACAYAEHKDSMSEEETELITRIIPNVEQYNASLSDPVKRKAKAKQNFPDFIRLYLKLLSRYPVSYVKAFCSLDAGYLSLTDTTFGRIYGTSNRQGVFLSDTKEGFDIHPISFFPALENLCEKLYSENKYENVIGLRLMCTPSLYFWLMCCYMLLACRKKQRELIPMISFMIVFLLTILAGPCALVRYALPYIICLPTMGACVLLPGENNDRYHR